MAEGFSTVRCSDCGREVSALLEGVATETGSLELVKPDLFGGYHEADSGEVAETYCSRCVVGVIVRLGRAGYVRCNEPIECIDCGSPLGLMYLGPENTDHENETRSWLDVYGGEFTPLGAVASVIDDRYCAACTAHRLPCWLGAPYDA